ncbi:MAG: nylA [Acidimicrobiales bacterium]|nr:nylA [Acidimicrobiales bacterium]
MVDDYESNDAVGLAALVAAGETTPAELLDEAVARMERWNPALNAVVLTRIEEARAEIAARPAAAGGGALRGVPFLLKDLHAHAAGSVLTDGWQAQRDRRSDRDSTIVARYRDAGLVIFGRTTSPEFGLLPHTVSDLWGQTRNPWDPDRSPGGSSGGAAAAVAAGIVPVAHASDGGGSIRIPASCCGLFGLKPTRGRTPSGPHRGEGWAGMSVQHVVSRTVRDSAAFLDVTAGPDQGAPYWAPPPAQPFAAEVGAPPGRIRVGLITERWDGGPLDPVCREAVEDAARLCESLGHHVEPASLDGVDTSAAAAGQWTIVPVNVANAVQEAGRALGRELGPDDMGAMTALQMQLAARVSGVDYLRAVHAIHAAGRQLAARFEQWDVLLLPTMATRPLPVDRFWPVDLARPGLVDDLVACAAFTALFNATGNPAMSVPLHRTPEGLPIGVQFVGRLADEATLFRLAAQLEAARPWADRRPRPP